jgi:hypothetical protein
MKKLRGFRNPSSRKTHTPNRPEQNLMRTPENSQNPSVVIRDTAPIPESGDSLSQSIELSQASAIRCPVL